MANDLYHGIATYTIRFRLLCLLCIAGILAFIAADAHAKSAAEIFDIASKSTVVVFGYDGKGKALSQGSGVAMPDGSVVTNCHVIEKASLLVVRHQKREHPATRLHSDWDRDTCSLSVRGLNAPAVRLGSTQRLKVGTRVYAIGAPQGLELSLSEGIVSSLREIKGGQYIQTTTPISPGSSGGGLFDAEGRLLGLTTFYLAKGQNLNFALPVEWISELPKRHTRTSKSTITTVGWTNKTMELESMKDWQGMIAHCQSWIEAEPRNAAPWFCLGSAYGKSGQILREIESYQKFININPENAEAWYNLGLAYGKSGPISREIECYQRALTIKPEHASAWYNLGVTYGKLNQNSKAIDCYQRVIKINPEDATAWTNIGVIYGKLNQNSKAIDCYQRALSINPDNELIWTNLGVTYFKLNENSKAIDCYQRALSINPEYAKAWYGLGVVYSISGKNREVMEIHRRLKGLDPKLADRFFRDVVLP